VRARNPIFALAISGALACPAALAMSDADISRLAQEAARGSEAARQTVERLAGEGATLAEHAMGLMYLSGKGMPQSESQSVAWFLRAARKGHVESAHNLGVIHERSGGAARDPHEARRWYRQAAEAGFARSQANLGRLLAEGIGGPADLPGARRWIEKAAEQDEPHGRYLLGMFTLEGRAGIDKDASKAARLIGLAAEAGDRDAQYRLALLRGSGVGAEKSDPIALEWLRKAAAQRHPDAEYLLGVVHATGRYGVERDDRLAAVWLRRAARQGHLDAQVSLGLAYAEGRGVSRDASEAYGWLLEAARRGHPAAIELVRKIRPRALERSPD
jgi:hypothetical protein